MRKYYSPLIGAALATASLFQFSLPTFAAGTAANTTLRNTATGNYQDDAGNNYTIDSNTVEVTVAKVAGITNQPSAINDRNGGNVLTGDTLEFVFEITNVGNDSTNIFIPDAQNIATNGLVRGTNGDALTVEVSQINPGTSPAFVDRPTDGIIENVPINGKILVRVIGDVDASASGALIDVLLGNTGPNTEPNNPVAETQNQPDTDGGETGEEPNDVRTTVTAAATSINDPNAVAPTVTGAPADGQREASALQQVRLGSNPLAITRIEKVRGAVQDNNTPATPNALNDDTIPYSLNLEVLNTTPNSRFTPGNLTGRDYTAADTGTFNNYSVAASDQTSLILVSDAIPAGTTLNTNNVNTPAGWTPVYTDADPTTVLPDEATWTTNAGSLTNITRVGWVYDARPTGDGGSGPIAIGDTIPTFTFSVTTTGLNATSGGTVANIAQVFGSTVGSNSPVFDESGDQNPSNFNDDGTVGPDEEDPQSTGVANPANHDVDSNNDNTATGSIGGEDNVIIIGAPGALLNGPNGQSDATGDVFGVGPDNNHDFQNLSQNRTDNNDPDTAVSFEHDGSTTFDPDVVRFNNTLSNPGGLPLTNVLLQPINPEFDASFNGDATDDDLPNGTLVTLTLGGQTATYEYTVDTSGRNPVGRFDLINGQPIEIPSLSENTDLDYTVDVDLPNGTGLSTDTAINRGFPVPIVAFIDEQDPNNNNNRNGRPDPATENYNVTVNQVYTGFVKVTKQVQITAPNGDVRKAFDAADDPNVNTDDARPGDTLTYRVIYRNISEPQIGSGNNGVLNGVNVTIAEDGTLANVSNAPADANNWALDNNGDDDLDTINVQNSATDTNNGEINFYIGTTDASGSLTPLSDLSPVGTLDPGDTVTGYSVTVQQLAPVGAEDSNLNVYNPNDGDSAFEFQRVVDDFDGLVEEDLD